MDGVIKERLVMEILPEPATLIARARAMIPVLKSRAPQAEADRKVPVETIRDFQEAGFFDILKPKRWGGFEMEPQVFYEVQMAIAEGCMLVCSTSRRRKRFGARMRQRWCRPPISPSAR